MNEIHISKPKNNQSSYLLITAKNNERVFEINCDASVGYVVKGKYKMAKNDKDLGIALGEAFKLLVELNKAQLTSKK